MSERETPVNDFAQDPPLDPEQPSSEEASGVLPTGLARLLQRFAERLLERAVGTPPSATEHATSAAEPATDSSPSSPPEESSESPEASPVARARPVRMMQVFVFESSSSRSRSSESSSDANSQTESSGEGPREASRFPGRSVNRRMLIYTVEISGNGVGNMVNSEANFQEILDRLARAYEARGPPPASKDAIDRLPELEITDELVRQSARCTVCCEDFELGGPTALDLPCHHLFHKDCITTWISQHNTCPVCRYELPVDDPDYERDRKQRMARRGFTESSDDERPEKKARTDDDDSVAA
eukprot:TRINITY_DN2214_c0_g1_i1.p1 TRINITY_DN2214_c0_g1~~TRINITY_DN2214_c0_g1_i1.p1  ORF type:complete len:299 (+),score=58.54 TRINITY_DN2214_c0_g1_i1:91-987(+)